MNTSQNRSPCLNITWKVEVTHEVGRMTCTEVAGGCEGVSTGKYPKDFKKPKKGWASDINSTDKI